MARPSGHFRFSVAPMIDVTDVHFRQLARLLSRHTRLYTEMITTGAILHGKRERMLAFPPEQHAVALQLGGSDPAQLAEAAHIGAGYGYDELNLNCGCPSDRVQNGAFGACLMLEPLRVRDCLRAMGEQGRAEVTLKCRIGIDQQDSFDDFLHFIDTATDSPCNTVIVHARNAWLQGLSPKENREIPPLKYDWVYRLKDARPELTIVLNGGVTSLAQAQAHLQQVDGVMVGREAWHNTWHLSEVDQQLFAGLAAEGSGLVHDQGAAGRIAVCLQYVAYCREVMAREGVSLNILARHVLGLFHQFPGGRAFRRYISEHAHRKGADVSVIEDALALIKTDADKNTLRQNPTQQEHSPTDRSPT